MTNPPAGTGRVSQLDTDLWKSYNTDLRNFVFSSNKLNPKTQAFFVAPVGTMGLPAAQNIPQPITNGSLSQVADCLLDINSPVFTPGSAGSYINRQSRYLNSIQLKKNTNAGAWLRLQVAEKKRADLDAKMSELKPKAQNAFEADTDKPERMPFRTWVSRNYPNFDSLESELQQAASAKAAAMIEVYGPGAMELNRKISSIDKALDEDRSNPGKNMPVSDQQADMINGTTLDENAIPKYKPIYKIDQGYGDAVKQWIANSASGSESAKPVTISITTPSNPTESWEDSGFSKSSASISAQYGFISAQTPVNNVNKEVHISAEQLGPSLSATLRATGIKAFNVTPGDWDADFGNIFRDVSLVANFSLPPACAVSQIIVGYNVSIDISMGSDAAKQVSDLYSRTTSAGGSLSIFGIPIGAGGGQESGESIGYSIQNNQNSFSSFSIAAADNRQPVVLGVVGRKLPALGKGK